MGNCVGAGTPEERDAKSRSSAIDRQLRQDQKEYENTIKILLLGKPQFTPTLPPPIVLSLCVFPHDILSVSFYGGYNLFYLAVKKKC